MPAPRCPGRSRVNGFFHLPMARNATRAAISSTPAVSVTVCSLSMVNRTLSIPDAEPGRKPLGKALAQLAPQQTRRRARFFFDGGRQLNQLAHVLFHMPSTLDCELGVFFEEWHIGTEIDTNVPILFVCSLVEERTKSGNADQARLADPARPGLGF